MDLMELFRVGFEWLCHAGTYPVSLFDFSCWIDLYRLNLDPAASTSMSNDII